MTTESPICCGCMVRPNFAFPTPVIRDQGYDIWQGRTNESNNGLTDAEKEVLHLLKEAWQKFSELGSHTSHDLTEYNYAIHLAQQKIATRVARRVNPEVWSQPPKEE